MTRFTVSLAIAILPAALAFGQASGGGAPAAGAGGAQAGGAQTGGTPAGAGQTGGTPAGGGQTGGTQAGFGQAGSAQPGAQPGGTRTGRIPGGPAATSGTRGSSAYGTAGGTRAGETGRLGTRHPNSAAGPVRSSGITQTGPARSNARTQTPASRQPGARFARPLFPVGPLAPLSPLDGRGIAVPGDPSVPATPEQAVPPLAGEAVPSAVGAVPPAQRRALPGGRAFGETAPQTGAGDSRHIVAPLTGDLEFGLQPRTGNPAGRELLEQQALLSQRAAATATAPRQHVVRRVSPRSAETPDVGRTTAPPQLYHHGGRWWYRSRTGKWLVWNVSSQAWMMYDPRLGTL